MLKGRQIYLTYLFFFLDVRFLTKQFCILPVVAGFTYILCSFLQCTKDGKHTYDNQDDRRKLHGFDMDSECIRQFLKMKNLNHDRKIQTRNIILFFCSWKAFQCTRFYSRCKISIF